MADQVLQPHQPQSPKYLRIRRSPRANLQGKHKKTRLIRSQKVSPEHSPDESMIAFLRKAFVCSNRPRYRNYSDGKRSTSRHRRVSPPGNAPSVQLSNIHFQRRVKSIDLQKSYKQSQKKPLVQRAPSNLKQRYWGRRVSPPALGDLDPTQETDESDGEGHEAQSAKLQLQRGYVVDRIKQYFLINRVPPATGLDFYDIGRVIGKGAFGQVILGTHKLTGQNVAIKSIDKKFIRRSEYNCSKVHREIQILKMIRHPNIVRILEVFESWECVLIVMEYCGGGDLLQFVRNKTRLSETEAKSIFRQLMYGARVCHANKVLHRDFKLDNMLLNANLDTAKICDFGISKFIEPNEILREDCGTPAYLAPEIIADTGYKGFGSDIWSLGVCLYAMVTGTVPFRAPNVRSLHKDILRAKYTIPDHVSPEAQDLIHSMLSLIPQKRPDVTKILAHPWLTTHVELPPPAIVDFVENSEDALARHGFLEGPVSIDPNLLDKLAGFGFPRTYMQRALVGKELNHATATYYLLQNSV